MFNQRVSGAFDRARPAQCAQAAADQRGLAGAEVAGQRDDHSAAERRREPRAGRGRRVGIGKVNRVMVTAWSAKRRRAIVRRDGSRQRTEYRMPPMRYAWRHGSSPRQPPRSPPTQPPHADRDWAALAARHCALGPRAGLRGDRHRRHRSSPPTKRGCCNGWPRAATAPWITWHATARPARGRRELVPGTVRVITARMNYLPPAARAADRRARRSAQGVHRALRARPRLPQGAARAACSGSPTAIRARGRRVRLSRVHRQRAGARSRARREVRPRLARQAHAAAHARPGLVVLPGRDLHRSAAAADAAADGALRHLHRVHRRLPDRRDRRAVRARRAPLHFVSDDRASRAAFRRNCGR